MLREEDAISVMRPPRTGSSHISRTESRRQSAVTDGASDVIDEPAHVGVLRLGQPGHARSQQPREPIASARRSRRCGCKRSEPNAQKAGCRGSPFAPPEVGWAVGLGSTLQCPYRDPPDSYGTRWLRREPPGFRP